MSAIPAWYFVLCMGVFGLLFGSFANVVIWRLPRGESIVSPGSHCPGCDSPIVWYDNIPVFSWVVLRAKCRACGEPIAVRYPIVEAASGALFILAAVAFDAVAQAVLAAVLFWFLLVLSVIDLDTMRLPNPLVAILAGVGVVAAVVAEIAGVSFAPLVGVSTSGWLAHPLVVALAGSLIGAGVSGGIAGAYGALRGKAGLGMGDVKLLGALGLYLGPYVLLGLFLGSLIGIVVGLSAPRGDTTLANTRIPFGPSLAAGGILAATLGPALVGWYLGVCGLG